MTSSGPVDDFGDFGAAPAGNTDPIPGVFDVYSTLITSLIQMTDSEILMVVVTMTLVTLVVR